MPAGYFAPATGLLWRIVEHYGRKPQVLFDAFEITEKMIADPEVRLPIETAEALWHHADAEIGDPQMGLLAARYLHPSHLGALGYAWLASPTLRDALARLTRYIRLLTEEREIIVENRNDHVDLVTRLEPSARALPLRADIAMTVLMTMCRWDAGPELAATRVTFRHDRPTDHRAFEEFFRSTVIFGAPRDVITLKAADVEKLLPSGNPQLAELNDDYLMRYLARLDADGIEAKVQAVIVANLGSGDLRLERIAKRLHISPRTLQRRLEEAGTSFRALVERTRREVVEQLLPDPRLSLTDIAFCAGFASLGNLSTAVRNWTGASPSEYRKRLQAAPAAV